MGPAGCSGNERTSTMRMQIVVRPGNLDVVLTAALDKHLDWAGGQEIMLYSCANCRRVCHNDNDNDNDNVIRRRTSAHFLRVVDFSMNH